MIIFIILLQAIAVFLFATVTFDLVHYSLHLCLKSSNPLLRKLGGLHLPHHRFYNMHLQIDQDHQRANLRSHILLENAVQFAMIMLCLLWIDPIAVMIAGLFQIFLLLMIIYLRGQDPHHRSCEQLHCCSGGPYVTADYHALHHVYAQQYYSSYIKLLDYLLGTAHHLAHKHIVMTGASGALGSHMKRLLENEQAEVVSLKYGKDYTYNDYEKCIPALEQADILFLCHGSKHEDAQAANCDSYIQLIELYQKVRKPGLLPLEIWATGSEIECHPCFGIKKLYPYANAKRNYARYARRLYHDKNLQYRHLVHSAFTSRMGPGLMSSRFAAWMTLFMLKRGFRYVPVTYTGFAWLNYFRFIFPGRSSSPQGRGRESY